MKRHHELTKSLAVALHLEGKTNVEIRRALAENGFTVSRDTVRLWSKNADGPGADSFDGFDNNRTDYALARATVFESLLCELTKVLVDTGAVQFEALGMDWDKSDGSHWENGWYDAILEIIIETEQPKPPGGKYSFAKLPILET